MAYTGTERNRDGVREFEERSYRRRQYFMIRSEFGDDNRRSGLGRGARTRKERVRTDWGPGVLVVTGKGWVVVRPFEHVILPIQLAVYGD